jgi:hypothetical protein
MLEIWIRDSSQCWKYGYGIHLNDGNMDTGFISMLEIWIQDSSRCWKYGYGIHPDTGLPKSFFLRTIHRINGYKRLNRCFVFVRLGSLLYPGEKKGQASSG